MTQDSSNLRFLLRLAEKPCSLLSGFSQLEMRRPQVQIHGRPPRAVGAQPGCIPPLTFKAQRPNPGPNTLFASLQVCLTPALLQLSAFLTRLEATKNDVGAVIHTREGGLADGGPQLYGAPRRRASRDPFACFQPPQIRRCLMKVRGGGETINLSH